MTPDSLKPTQTPDEVTEEAASRFAVIARALQTRGNAPEQVAHFLNEARPTPDMGEPGGGGIDAAWGIDEDERARLDAWTVITQTITERIRAGYTQALVYNDYAGDRGRLVQLPPTLLDFLYLQFARAVESPPEYRRCDGCGQWLAIGSGHRTVRTNVCDDACRQRKQRRLKREALALRGDGAHPSEIADRLGVTEDRVRTLLKPRRRKTR